MKYSNLISNILECWTNFCHFKKLYGIVMLDKLCANGSIAMNNMFNN